MARPRIKRIIKPIVQSKVIDQSDRYSCRKTRNSMRVNLSFISILTTTESDNDSLKKKNNKVTTTTISPVKKRIKSKKIKISKKDATNPVKSTNITEFGPKERTPCSEMNNVNKTSSNEAESDELNFIEEKELQLSKSCMQLKDAIMSKTRAIFDKENELAIKTSEILTGHSSRIQESELNETNDQRTPSIRVDIGKNQQIVMSGDGKKRNPVEVVSAMKHQLLEKNASLSQKNNDDDYMDCNQSIMSTPRQKKIDNNTSKNNKSCRKISSDAAGKIPVARLFDSDPSRTVSDLNLVQSLSNLSNEIDKEKNERVDKSLISNFMNNSSSPILSQGRRKSRFSLSLKKKVSKTPTEESFLQKQPLVSSSLIDDKPKEVDKNSSTINLVDSTNPNKTVNIDDSTSKSCMEITTTVSSQMPIIRRTFQNLIRKSLKLDNLNAITMTQNEVESNQNLEVSKNFNNDSLTSQKEQNKEEHQDDCSVNTVRTSLNVNTSLDRISSADSIAQKENKKPNNTDSISNSENSKNHQDDVLQCQNTFLVPATKTTMLNSNKLYKKHQMKKRSDNSPGIRNSESSKEKDNVKITSKKSNSSDDQENDERLSSRQPSISSIRSSMQVNTSLDSVRKSPVQKNILNFDKMITMREKKTFEENQSSSSTNDDSDLENVSLMQRLKNISESKGTNKLAEPSRKRKSSTETDEVKKKKINKNDDTDKDVKQNSTGTALRNTRKSFKEKSSHGSLRKSVNSENSSNEASVVETTPFPTSRSVLLKTLIKNNLALNTISLRKIVDHSNDQDDYEDDDDDTNLELQTVIHKKTPKVSFRNKSKSVAAKKMLDTILVNETDESLSESEQDKERVIIEETVNVTKTHDKSKNNKSVGEKLKVTKNIKSANKRKLYMNKDNSLVSFSPTESQETREVRAVTQIKRKPKKRQAALKKKPEVVDSNVPELTPELGRESENEDNIIISPVIEIKKKKPRKILRKKIVVKKTRNMEFLENMMENGRRQSSSESLRDSLKEFDLKKMKRKEKINKNNRIVIVVTGLPIGDKDLVKSVIKALGSAVLEANVTPRTTHVISSGVRTINLLKGILRGCWLLSLEWALKSLESGKWLNPSPYEMSHFARAVQENRRDRQLFGKAYVPELFVTCGMIYIENGTSPPAPVLKELVKIAGGRITEDSNLADIEIGSEGLKEIWILDSITTGEVQSVEQYKRN